uniref:Uncharacterized protein n=1 Tax=Globisporangium ultimum (strain ATCC 200006 / CBS 805.95 / DAOM BR144) TaxID=431595 RepID=K3WNZ4_GLOUD
MGRQRLVEGRRPSRPIRETLQETRLQDPAFVPRQQRTNVRVDEFEGDPEGDPSRRQSCVPARQCRIYAPGTL